MGSFLEVGSYQVQVVPSTSGEHSVDGCGLGEGVMVGTNFVIMHALSSLLMFSREGLSELFVLQLHFRGPRKI